MSGFDAVNEVTTQPRSLGVPETETACVACSATNAGDGKFCASCGHSLYEPCNQCAQPVLLTQSFCGNCGCDLAAVVEQKRIDLESRISTAMEAAKQSDFILAKSALESVIQEKDVRFSNVVLSANESLQKIAQLAERETNTASRRIAAAMKAHEQEDSLRVIELLAGLSGKMLPSQAVEILRIHRERLETIEISRSALKEAFSKRDWATAGVALDRLSAIDPNDASVKKLGVKVGKKLISRATDLQATHKFGAAIGLLDAVPSVARDRAFDQLQDSLEQTLWLARQFDDEPFATSSLGSLAMRWTQFSNNAPAAQETLARLRDRIKQPCNSSRDLFPQLSSASRSWVGGEVGFMGYPRCIDCREPKFLQRAPGQFAVAIGLALQGLGKCRITGDFSPAKKGLLQRLGKKKQSRCWGIDMGASGIKAVLLEDVPGDRPRLLQTYFAAFDAPLTRRFGEGHRDELIRLSISQLRESCDLDKDPVWASFPAYELVSRFVRLPSVADKQANSLFKTEIKQQIPIPLDEVVYVDWIADLPAAALEQMGRPAFVSAAKLRFVSRYIESLSSAGLDVSGLQAAPIALANFAFEEFKEESCSEITIDNLACKSTVPTTAMVDCGAETTTMVFVNRNTVWFGSLESGGDEFTRMISKETKSVHREAEKSKRSPASLDLPHQALEACETRMDEIRVRLRKMVSETLRSHPETDVQSTWCCGGGSRTHGWIRRVLGSESI